MIAYHTLGASRAHSPWHPLMRLVWYSIVAAPGSAVKPTSANGRAKWPVLVGRRNPSFPGVLPRSPRPGILTRDPSNPWWPMDWIITEFVIGLICGSVGMILLFRWAYS